MSIESDLKKDGIENIRSMNTLTINKLAKRIAESLCEAFPSLNLDYDELFIRLSRINMYKAKMPKGFSEANYFYKNSSIYFNEDLKTDHMIDYAIHEAIHHLQEIKDKKGYLLRLGLCDFSEFKIYGMALNEAAVQYMASKAVNSKKESVKYYGITFSTTSPNCYSLECNLLEQLIYITGEDSLIDSTFHSNDEFKYDLIEFFGETSFYTIQKNLDTLLYAEEDLIKLNNKLQQEEENSKNLVKIVNKIDITRQKISNTYIETQNLIIFSYFNKAFKKIKDLEQLDEYRRKLYNFKDLIGTYDNYTFFNDYYVEQMARLEEKHHALENATSLIPISNNKIVAFFRAIKNMILKPKEELTKPKEEK